MIMDWENRIAFGLAITLGCSLYMVLWNFVQQQSINKLKHRVSCLEQPHGESSISGKLVTINGKRTFVVTQPTHRTGC